MGTNNNQIKTILRDRVNPKSTGGWYKLIKGIQSDGIAYIDTKVYVHTLYHRQYIDMYHYPITDGAPAHRICGYGSETVSSGIHGCYSHCSMYGPAIGTTMSDTLSGPVGNVTRNVPIIAAKPWYNRHVLFTEGSANESTYRGWFSLYDFDTGLTYVPNEWDNMTNVTGVSAGGSKLFCMGTGTKTISPVNPFLVVYEYTLCNGMTAAESLTERVHLYPCILTQNIDGSLDSKNTPRIKNTVGMYDSISGKFFANAASSGQFIAVLS